MRRHKVLYILFLLVVVFILSLWIEPQLLSIRLIKTYTKINCNCNDRKWSRCFISYFPDSYK